METKEDKSMTRHAAEARGSEPGDLYQRDYYTWALEQARALRTRRGEALDWENLAEEVEGLALSEERELESRLEVLLVHLLNWCNETKKRSRSWQLTIREQPHRVQGAESESRTQKNPLRKCRGGL